MGPIALPASNRVSPVVGVSRGVELRIQLSVIQVSHFVLRGAQIGWYELGLVDVLLDFLELFGCCSSLYMCRLGGLPRDLPSASEILPPGSQPVFLLYGLLVPSEACLLTCCGIFAAISRLRVQLAPDLPGDVLLLVLLPLER